MAAATVQFIQDISEPWTEARRSAGVAKTKRSSARPSTELNINRRTDLAIPRRGHVLSTVVELHGKPIREAAAILAHALAESHPTPLFPLNEKRIGAPPSARSEAEMAAWAIVSKWVVGVAVEALLPDASLAEAQTWFSGPDQQSPVASARATREAEIALQSNADAKAYAQLLPYLLDPHGPGSRLSVKKDPSTHSARKRKRAQGVFYTPADVAEYMARACISDIGRDNTPPTVLDPACGTGVFLRAALKELRAYHPTESALSLASEYLFGTDIDPWPLDAAAFVLLADCWNDSAEAGVRPAEMWLAFRKNFACIDTLLINPAGSELLADQTRVRISELFPALGEGPNVVLGNPPYANLGFRTDTAELGRIFKSLSVKAGPNAEICLAFVEQMIRLADSKNCAGALILPLSFACNVGHQFFKTRELISKTRGHWRFAFFDREPHALFGEDVKTRNAIVLWSRSPADTRTVLETGPLRKWRGDSRAAMFKSVRFTATDTDIRPGIPKIDGPLQAAALQALRKRWGRLEQVAQGIERINLAEVPKTDKRTVLVGATAYNFVNVFLRPPKSVLSERKSLSEHPLHAVRCGSKEDALAVFAILSSHLAYWWWHIHGDGFHVSKRFIAELPFGQEALNRQVTATLAEQGAALWSAIKAKPIISLNRGSASLAYTPNGHDGMRRKADETLATLAGLDDAFVDEIQRFTAHTIAATLHGDKVVASEEEEMA